MEPKLPPDRDKEFLLQQQQSVIIDTTASSGTIMTAVSSFPSVPVHNTQLMLHSNVSGSPTTSTTSISGVQQPIEKLSRPMAFDKMEILVREMQDPDNGVPVRSQKIFLTSIPSAFMGYDLIEWLMERLNVEESEALNLANQLCQHGYFFPVSDSKSLVVKDDSSLYRFQSPYYWPWRQQKAPDQIEYAIYLAKRSLRNKQRHGLEEYETEALASLHKNLKGKWDFITMQAEEQIKLAKDRKKGDKIVGDSQERAYWRVHRPPPGQFTPLEPCPIPSRDRQGKPRKRTVEDWQREIDILKTSMGRNRVKMSVACECLVQYFDTFSEYDPVMQPALPSNPWVTEDITFWQLNSPLVEIHTEKRVKRWGISIEDLVSDPTGLHEFTMFLKKEYSHENIRFWSAVNDMRRAAHSQIQRIAKEIYEEFLEPGAPCEINIDGKTMEKVHVGLKSPSRFTFDVAAEHVYTLLLKKDCYPRFTRSEYYKNLLANAIQPSQKKRFFGFGGPAKKKSSTAAPPTLLAQMGGNSTLSRRRGSDRSLSGSAHELAICGVKQDPTKVPHSHSQTNLSEIPYRGDMPSGSARLTKDYSEPPFKGKSLKIQESTKPTSINLETTMECGASSVCPWDEPEPTSKDSVISVSVCPWEDDVSEPIAITVVPKQKTIVVEQTSQSEIVDVSEKMRKSCGLRQNTLDSDFHSTKRLTPNVSEQRRASMTMAPRLSDLQFVSKQHSLSGDSETEEKLLEPTNVINKNDSIEEGKEEEDEEHAPETEPLLEIIEEPQTIPSDRKPSIDSIKVSTDPKTLSKNASPITTDPHVQDLVSTECDLKKMRKLHRSKSQNVDDKYAQSIESDDITKSQEDEHYKELTQQPDDFEIGMATGLLPGCVAPAPTPAPSIAPLAEMDADPADDDNYDEHLEAAEAIAKPDQERKKKKREKRDAGASSEGTSSKSKQNAVCPWDDDDITNAVEAPFVKTYATLGYL